MASIDELMSDFWAAVSLPEGAIPHHALVAIEYSLPEQGGARRLMTVIDNDNPPWLVQGMCCHIQDKVVEDMFSDDEED